MKEDSNDDSKNRLSNWKIVSRSDADDGEKHMGLLILQSKTSLHQNLLSKTVFVKRYKYEDKDEVFAQIATLTCTHFDITFIYINRTPSFGEVERISQTTQNSKIIMGDLNLDP